MSKIFLILLLIKLILYSNILYAQNGIEYIKKQLEFEQARESGVLLFNFYYDDVVLNMKLKWDRSNEYYSLLDTTNSIYIFEQYDDTAILFESICIDTKFLIADVSIENFPSNISESEYLSIMRARFFYSYVIIQYLFPLTDFPGTKTKDYIFNAFQYNIMTDISDLNLPFESEFILVESNFILDSFIKTDTIFRFNDLYVFDTETNHIIAIGIISKTSINSIIPEGVQWFSRFESILKLPCMNAIPQIAYFGFDDDGLQKYDIKLELNNELSFFGDIDIRKNNYDCKYLIIWHEYSNNNSLLYSITNVMKIFINSILLEFIWIFIILLLILISTCYVFLKKTYRVKN